MVHIEQILWPVDLLTVTLHNINETELWIFKDRLYNGLCTVKEEPHGVMESDNRPAPPVRQLYYTMFEDNANIYYGVYTNGNPSSDWCYVREVRKLECGHVT